METEGQRKDRERLERFIAREQLVSIMNATKWEKLRVLLLSKLDFTPLWREQYLRSEPIGDYPGNWEWTNGPPLYRGLEWVEIDPVERQVLGAMLDDKETDHTSAITVLLKEHKIPFSIEGGYIKIWGYQRPGATIEFE